MSIMINPSIPSATLQLSEPVLFASALARFVSRRRGELGLSVVRAAELAGLEVSEWCALELGWVPEELAMIRAIAATLEVSWTDLDMLALFAGCAQQSR